MLWNHSTPLYELTLETDKNLWLCFMLDLRIRFLDVCRYLCLWQYTFSLMSSGGCMHWRSGSPWFSSLPRDFQPLPTSPMGLILLNNILILSLTHKLIVVQSRIKEKEEERHMSRRNGKRWPTFTWNIWSKWALLLLSAFFLTSKNSYQCYPIIPFLPEVLRTKFLWLTMTCNGITLTDFKQSQYVQTSFHCSCLSVCAPLFRFLYSFFFFFVWCYGKVYEKVVFFAH